MKTAPIYPTNRRRKRGLQNLKDLVADSIPDESGFFCSIGMGKIDARTNRDLELAGLGIPVGALVLSMDTVQYWHCYHSSILTKTSTDDVL